MIVPEKIFFRFKLKQAVIGLFDMFNVLPGDEVSSAVIIACVFDVKCVEPTPAESFPAAEALATATIAAAEHPCIGESFSSIAVIVMTLSKNA